MKDIHEFLAEIDFRALRAGCGVDQVTYHESCHLKHGQQVSEAPRQILRAIPDLDLIELVEADWCCGSAGIYNITQPETSMRLLTERWSTCAIRVCASSLRVTRCVIQLQHGGQREEMDVDVVHPISLLAAAYRKRKAVKHYGLTIDLKDDPELIAQYKAHHADPWPEPLLGLREIGITDMKIFLLGTRMFIYDVY